MSKKIWNIVVIGCGAMAKLHMKGIIATEGAELYGICDSNAERLQSAKEEIGVELCISDWKQFVEDPKVDAAVIVTPDQIHLEMTSAFLKAGKAVLCEKPMALTIEDCNEMRRIEKETNGKLMIGQICRFTPSFRMAKEYIEEGKLGDLYFVESEYAHNYQFLEPKWRKDPVNLRYSIIGGGCHAIDLLRWIAGNPEKVMALANKKANPHWNVDENTIAIMQFPNNVIGKIFCGTAVKRDYTMRTCLYGTKGTIICDNTSKELTLFRHAVTDNGKNIYPDVKIPVEVNNHNLYAEVKEMCAAIINDLDIECTALEGSKTVAVANACVMSAAKGGEPVVPPYIK